MAEGLLDALGPVLTRWTMGGSALPVAPVAWRGALGNEAGEAELRLLALAGQMLGTLTVVQPAGEIRMSADIPALAKPPLGDALRPRARRLLQTLRERDQRRALLTWLDRRGWTLHPGDWMPGANDDELPAVYAPWQDWAAQDAPTAGDRAEAISAETWNRFGPAARRVAWIALRRHDPGAAAALLMAQIGGEHPDRRLLFLDLLAAGLTAADEPVLAALASDRAPRVKARAAALLARLGHEDPAGEDAIELAGFFTIKSKGWLRKSQEIVPQELKTPAQRTRRLALLGQLSIGAMAHALGLTPEALIAAWPWGRDVQADHALAAMAERSATDPVLLLVGDALVGLEPISLHALMPILPRMSVSWRRQTALQVLDAPGGAFATALMITGGDSEIDDAITTGAGRTLVAALRDADEPKPTDHAAELLALGLVATRRAAKQALDHLADAGLIASDPRLDMLRLNAALEQRDMSE